MRDPTPAECAGCLRRLSPPNNWLCDPCAQIAVELGYEASPFYAPDSELAKILWNKSREKQRAETAKRCDGQAQPKDPA